MVGVITGWDVSAHPISMIRCFGWTVFFRAVEPWQTKPFLSLLRDAGFFGTATSAVPTILERCIALELRAKTIYRTLARAFSDEGLAGPFFAGLAEQEQYHADLLEVCRAADSAWVGRPTCSTLGRTISPVLSNRWMRLRQPSITSVPWKTRCDWSFRSILGGQRGLPCCSGRHGRGLCEETQAVSGSDGGSHGVHHRTDLRIISSVDTGLPGVAGQVSDGAEELNYFWVLVFSGSGGRKSPRQIEAARTALAATQPFCTSA